MKLNRKRMVTGLVATGLVAGALAGGGVALASTGAAPASATSTSASPSYGPGTGNLRRQVTACTACGPASSRS